ncbi:MAG: TatD family hydrolase [Oscillospiraceae bacterium]|nr:TatD family hydrolase [Oscillospiraceae bacterium]
MAGPIFDTHAHYTSGAFNADRHEVLAGLPAQGVVGVCDCATHSGDAAAVIALAEKFDFVWAAVGIHPESLIEEQAATVYKYGGDWQAELKDMLPLFEHPKVVAVGECGLDHHWPVPAEPQLAMFEAHLQLSAQLGKPIIMHDREAHAETYALLKKYKPKGILHCYSGSAEDAKWIAAQGIYLGFGGTCTYKNARKTVEALQAVPLEQILLETDAPYLSPVPLRGKRNHSGNIQYVGELIAQVKGITPEEVFETTAQNARRVFGLPG